MRVKKKILILVAALMLAAQPAALANYTETEIVASCLIPDIVIEVNVPVSGTVYINPYELPIELSGNRTSNAQIVSDTAYIENLSDVPVRVSAEAYGDTLGEMELFAVSTKGIGNIGKFAFIYFEMKATSDPNTVVWDSGYDADKHLIILDNALPKNNIAVLGAAGKANCYGAFHLSGDCVKSPPIPWNERDGVTVHVSFTFDPIAPSEDS